MKYKLRRNNNPSQRSYGKFIAKAQHFNTITQEQLEEEIQRNCSATAADCRLVMCEFAETLRRHLQDGDKVELPYIGTAKLEIVSASVEEKEDFDPKKHIKRVQVHVIPKSENGVIEMYKGVKFEQSK